MHRKRLVAMGGFGKQALENFVSLRALPVGPPWPQDKSFLVLFFEKVPLAFHFAVP
jgi:hypothetical protein